MDKIKQDLQKAGITRTALVVGNYKAPRQAQFQKASQAYNDHGRKALVWCGYGEGRTGTIFSAVQMFTEHKRRSPEGVTREDYDANKVEKVERRNALDNLQEKLKKSRDPKPTLKDKLPSFFKRGKDNTNTAPSGSADHANKVPLEGGDKDIQNALDRRQKTRRSRIPPKRRGRTKR
ncbi:protein-tyrosine phosphatase [Moelleriella libera RCEF 2490]|uniref:Protein-tyrosine phosphatase n=1 Tax=Moelleriella libera RCEF 2490 TaxID=1081109 RepID=A0A162IE85_9HYPO|nr:protein-tyrosine phosphatase [Moelleriella libera RCEF 2490]